MIETDPRGLHPARRRQLQRELEEARREWAAAREEDARLRDEVELAAQEAGEVQAALTAAQRAAIATEAAAYQTQFTNQQGQPGAARTPVPSVQAAVARVDQLRGALGAAAGRRAQAERRLHPSPLDDDVRLGRVVPVARRLSHGEQRVRALAAALGEAVPELADLPPAPPPGPPGDVERTMAWRAELVTLGVLGPDAPAARPLPAPPELPSGPPRAPAPVTMRPDGETEASPDPPVRADGDPLVPQVPPTRPTPEAPPPAVAPEAPHAPATGDPDLSSLRARLAAARERWG